MNRRQFFAVGAAMLSTTATAGCIGSIPNPLDGSSDTDGTPTSDPDPFAGVFSQGYSLNVRFETPPQNRRSNSSENTTSTAQTPSDQAQSSPAANQTSASKRGPGAADIAQVALVNSVDELVDSASIGDSATARLSLLSLDNRGRRIAHSYDFGRHTIVAITHSNQQFERPVKLNPELAIKRVAFPNQLRRADRRSDPVRYANPIIEFSNSGTAPGVIVEMSTDGSSVPNPRADREERRDRRRERTENAEDSETTEDEDDGEDTESSTPAPTLAPRGAAAHLITNPSGGPLPAVPIGVQDSVLVQTAFHPLAIPKEPYTADGEIGGGIASLRREYATTELDFDVYIQTRKGTGFSAALTVALDGGVSEISIDDSEYYVFRSPEMLNWEVEADNN